MGDFNALEYTKAQFEKAFNKSDAAEKGWTLKAYSAGSSNTRIEVTSPEGDTISHSFGKAGKDGVQNTGKGAISDKLFNRKFG